MRTYSPTDRGLLAGLVIGILGACAGNTSDDDVGGTSTDQDTDESADGVSTDSTSTSEETSGSASDTGETTDTTESESTDASDSSSTDTDSDSTDATDTSDPSCADDSYVGVALAEDGWGVGDLCDEIWVCASASQVALVQAAVPAAQCFPGDDCPESHCALSFQTIVDRPLFELICDALMIDGIDEAYCVVWGP